MDHSDDINSDELIPHGNSLITDPPGVGRSHPPHILCFLADFTGLLLNQIPCVSPLLLAITDKKKKQESATNRNKK